MSRATAVVRVGAVVAGSARLERTLRDRVSETTGCRAGRGTGPSCPDHDATGAFLAERLGEDRTEDDLVA